MINNKPFMTTITNNDVIITVDTNTMNYSSIDKYFAFNHFAFLASPKYNNYKIILRLMVLNEYDISVLLHSVKKCIASLPIRHFHKMIVCTNDDFVSTIIRGLSLENNIVWCREYFK